ncbi:MAG: S9 family peptidase [Pseudomonadota bacterium]
MTTRDLLATIRHASAPTRRAFLGALLLGVILPPLSAQAQSDWPWPEDVPSASSETPALAGGRPDIVRYLMARGASGELSPDGRQLAYVTGVTGEPQLWIVPVDGGFPRQLTFGRGVRSFRWVPDGSAIVYGADRDGNERQGYTRISADGLRETEVLPASEAFVVFGSFASDDEHFTYATTARNGVDFDIHVASLSSDEDRQVFEGSFGFFANAWQPNGDTVIVTETRGEDADDVYLLNASSGAISPLFKPEIAADYSRFVWDADGAGFYLLTNQDREYSALAYFELATESLRLLETPQADVETLAVFGDGRYVAWGINDGGYSRLQVRDLRTGRTLHAPGVLPRGVYNLSGAHHAPRLMVQVTGPRTPGDLWVWDVAAGETHAVVPASTAGLDRAAMVEPQSLYFEARDGVRLNGLLYLPNEIDGQGPRPPVVMMVHGGPTGQARPSFRAVTQYLVARGVAVFDLNFRGSTGFGKRFARLDNQRQRPNAVRDMADAVGFLRADGRVDAERVALMGGSYGGYLTNAGLGEFPDLFAAGVSFVGVSDWVRALEEASPALKASDRIEYGDINDPDDREFFRSISPINNVDRIKSPVLVIHGANDPRDPVTESDRFVQAIRDNLGQAQYLRFADEGHSISRLGNRVTAYTQVAQFLERHLGVD